MAVRLSMGPRHLIHPSFTRESIAKINTPVADALISEDSVRREASRVCSERLQSQRVKRWMEGDLELTCP
jgi:hypothetical protein